MFLPRVQFGHDINSIWCQLFANFKCDNRTSCPSCSATDTNAIHGSCWGSYSSSCKRADPSTSKTPKPNQHVNANTTNGYSVKAPSPLKAVETIEKSHSSSAFAPTCFRSYYKSNWRRISVTTVVIPCWRGCQLSFIFIRKKNIEVCYRKNHSYPIWAKWFKNSKNPISGNWKFYKD